MANSRIRISIVDSSPIVLRGLRAVLATTADMELQGGHLQPNDLASDPDEITTHMVLSEIQFKTTTTDQIIPFLRNALPNAKIVAFTTLDNIYIAKTVMRQGASGYILKTSGEQELLEAIRRIHSGEQYIEPDLKESIFQKALLNKKSAAAHLKLTRREKEILQLLASNYNSKEISKKLFISKKTVDNHRSNMLLKFKVRNAASLIKKAIELDLLGD